MQTIKIQEFFSSGLNRVFDFVQTIQIEDSPFDSGSFGEVYHCRKVNDQPLSTGLVIKTFSTDDEEMAERGYQTIRSLQEQIIAYNKNKAGPNKKSVQEIPALYALPQFIFKGLLGNKTVSGHVSNFLGQDYIQFSKLFEDKDKESQRQQRTQFYSQPLHVRLKMAHDLVEGFRVLEELLFIHADLNPKNFFVNIQSATLCIIDFDSGAVTKSPGDQATTFGKMGEWLAPEIQRQLISNDSHAINVDLNTDTWSVAIAIHYLFFPYHPLVYLGTLGLKQTEQYFRNYKWPQAEPKNPLFSNQGMKIYEKYTKNLYALPPSVFEGFNETINNGYYHPSRRLSYQQWLIRLHKLMETPVIENFSVDKTHVIKGIPVLFRWKADKAHTVVIDNGVGNVTGRNEIPFYPETDQLFTLTAIGHFGEVKKSVFITIITTPVIQSIKVPVPEFSYKFSPDFSKLDFAAQTVSVHTDDIKIPSLPQIQTSALQVRMIIPDAVVVPRSNSISGIFESIKAKLSHTNNTTL